MDNVNKNNYIVEYRYDPTSRIMVPIYRHHTLTYIWKFVKNYYKSRHELLNQEFLDDLVFTKCAFCEKCITKKKGAMEITVVSRTRFCNHACYHNCLTNKKLRAKLFPNINNDDQRKRQSETMKEKIRNGSFTPAVTNSWCHSRIKYAKDLYFRSSWEYAFYLIMVARGYTLYYEKLRIPYISPLTNTNRIYIVDFIDYENKIVYEIKPETVYTLETIAKENALKTWCTINEYTYMLCGSRFLMDNKDILKLELDVCPHKELMLKRLKKILE